MTRAIISFWMGLQRREQLTVLGGSFLIVGVAIFMLFSSLWQTRAELAQQRNTLLEERVWLEEQSRLAQRLTNVCRENQILALGSRELIELLASRNQIRLEAVDINGATLSLRVNTNNGDNILRFAFQSACQGYSLTGLRVDSTDAGVFQSRLEFRHES